MWSFTNLKLLDDQELHAAVSRLKQPGSTDAFLDVGCGLGQVPRKLAADGVDPAKLYGTDILSPYLDLGFELFRDGDRFSKGHFIATDLLSQDDTSLQGFKGKMTLIHASNFFHLFDWQQQIQMGINLAKLIQTDAKDAVIFGSQIGRLNAGPMVSPRTGTGRYLHDLSSLGTLWDELGQKSGTSWEVNSEWLGDLPFQIPGWPEDTRYMRFTIRRKL